jgi:type VI secretion system protein ImpC
MAQVDAATSDQMRQVLHHPEFQALEAAWRAVSFLVRGLETGVQLKLYLLDISKAELASDVVSTEDLRSSGIYRLLVEQTVGTPGGEPWAAVAANFTFGQTPEDIELLARMGMIARAARAPFLAGASPHLLGCESLAATPDPDDWQPEADPEGHQFWEALRAMPEAQYLGLALPRFLLRLPYGKDTEPTEQFDFEEMPEGSRHESYLWGNPAFVCAYLLGQAFSEFGWYLRPGVFQQIDGLPAHVYEEDGESHLKPCAEALLTNRAAEIILDEGLMPLLSIAGRADVRLTRFQSIAKPARPLAGQWG